MARVIGIGNRYIYNHEVETAFYMAIAYPRWEWASVAIRRFLCYFTEGSVVFRTDEYGDGYRDPRSRLSSKYSEARFDKLHGLTLMEYAGWSGHGPLIQELSDFGFPVTPRAVGLSETSFYQAGERDGVLWRLVTALFKSPTTFPFIITMPENAPNRVHHYTGDTDDN